MLVNGLGMEVTDCHPHPQGEAVEPGGLPLGGGWGLWGSHGQSPTIDRHLIVEFGETLEPALQQGT